MIKITNEDIEYAESKLLPPGSSFDEERRTFIKALDSCDVVACPGSGKTTALLAKLLILARKMPFKGGGGICVLTHTNVAIDEIKERLGSDADSLIGYPNFFGTIQAFADRFLAIPCFIGKFGYRPSVIDTERQLDKSFQYCDYTAKRWLEIQADSTRGAVSEKGFLAKVALDPSTLEFDLSASAFKKIGPHTKTHQSIKAACQKVLISGVLSYEQAFMLAIHHLKNHPRLAKLFAKRFRFVLIDEMQDTNATQLDVCEKIFPASSAVVQKVGDPNQAIFTSMKGEDMQWSPLKGAITFSSSMRFGSSIASVLTPVSVNRKMALSGNPSIKSMQPHIMTYNDESIGNVIKGFSALIEREGLDSNSEISKKVFKALGWVQKNNKTACIPHYWPQYRPPKKRTLHFDSFISYVSAYLHEACCSHSPKQFRKYIFQGLARLATLCFPKELTGGRVLSAQMFESWLGKNNPECHKLLLEEIAGWLQLAVIGVEIDELFHLIVEHLRDEPWLKPYLTRDASRFLNKSEVDPNAQRDSTCNTMCCSKKLDIQVGTVHSAKGETHTATMLMESGYYKKHESEYLMQMLKGKTPKLAKRQAECTKIAHVAMSRPTHLFVMACHQDRIADHEGELEANGWKVVSVEGVLEE